MKADGAAAFKAALERLNEANEERARKALWLGTLIAGLVRSNPEAPPKKIWALLPLFGVAQLPTLRTVQRHMRKIKNDTRRCVATDVANLRA